MLTTGTKYDYRKSMTDQAGIVYVRGCEVEGMLDASGRVIEEGPEPKPELDGDTRTFRLLLDPNQYRHDLDRASKGTEVRKRLPFHLYLYFAKVPRKIPRDIFIDFEYSTFWEVNLTVLKDRMYHKGKVSLQTVFLANELIRIRSKPPKKIFSGPCFSFKLRP